MAGASDNAPRWDGTRRGQYEVWYLTLNHRASETGYWICYTVDAPASAAQEPFAQVWFAFFDARNPAGNFGIRRTFAIDRAALAGDPFWAVYSSDGELVRTLEEIRLPARIPKAPREPLAQEDWFAVVDAIEQTESVSAAMRAVLCLIAVRGIRCGDVLRLTRREIKSALKTSTLAFEAKGERRVEYSAEPLRPYLEALLAESWSGRKRVRELIAPSAAEETQQESAARAVRRAFGQVAERIVVGAV